MQLERCRRLPVFESPYPRSSSASCSRRDFTASCRPPAAPGHYVGLGHSRDGFRSAPHCFKSTPLALTVDAAMGASWPRLWYVRLMISLSISSRVLLHRSSTSPGVRPAVGIGSSTAHNC